MAVTACGSLGPTLETRPPRSAYSAVCCTASNPKTRPTGSFGAHPALPAEAIGLLERGLDVGNADVEDHVAIVARASADATRDPGPVAGGIAIH
jgi:hypothetical protein